MKIRCARCDVKLRRREMSQIMLLRETGEVPQLCTDCLWEFIES